MHFAERLLVGVPAPGTSPNREFTLPTYDAGPSMLRAYLQATLGWIASSVFHMVLLLTLALLTLSVAGQQEQEGILMAAAEPIGPILPDLLPEPIEFEAHEVDPPPVEHSVAVLSEPIGLKTIAAAETLDPRTLEAGAVVQELVYPGKGLGRLDFGTTVASRASATQGTKWMLQTINRDGGCGTDVGQPSDIGCSAMVALALMSQGSTINEGPHSRELRRILDYMIGQTRRMRHNDITDQVNTQLQVKIGGHTHSFFAALFLSQVLREDADNTAVHKALDKVVTAIGRVQQSDGSWGTQSWEPMLGNLMGWVGLRSADSARLRVTANTKKSAEYLIDESIRLQNQRGQRTLYGNAAVIHVLHAMNQSSDARYRKAIEDVLGLVSQDNNALGHPGGEEYLAIHLITETIQQSGGKDWDRWYPVVRDKIVRVQNADGSWTGYHCITSRTFCTAAAVLVLEAPHRKSPISNEWPPLSNKRPPRSDLQPPLGFSW